MFLTYDELVELTERKTKQTQIAWLKANGFRFVIGANGNPKVLREHVQIKLCGNTNHSNNHVAPEPNWGAI